MIYGRSAGNLAGSRVGTSDWDENSPRARHQAIADQIRTAYLDAMLHCAKCGRFLADDQSVEARTCISCRGRSKRELREAKYLGRKVCSVSACGRMTNSTDGICRCCSAAARRRNSLCMDCGVAVDLGAKRCRSCGARARFADRATRAAAPRAAPRRYTADEVPDPELYDIDPYAWRPPA